MNTNLPQHHYWLCQEMLTLFQSTHILLGSELDQNSQIDLPFSLKWNNKKLFSCKSFSSENPLLHYDPFLSFLCFHLYHWPRTSLVPLRLQILWNLFWRRKQFFKYHGNEILTVSNSFHYKRLGGYFQSLWSAQDTYRLCSIECYSVW